MKLIGSLNRCQRGALLSTPRPALLRPGRFCGVSTSPNTTKSRGGAALPDLTVAAAANPTGSHVRVGLACLRFRRLAPGSGRGKEGEREGVGVAPPRTRFFGKPRGPGITETCPKTSIWDHFRTRNGPGAKTVPKRFQKAQGRPREAQGGPGKAQGGAYCKKDLRQF